MIAGTHSGAGKTSVALALTAALRRKGVKVQTFKIGPDFLDPTYLALASQRPCYNLDGWMTNKAYVMELFQRAAHDADLAVIEGVMGLFDGADPATSEGSTAEIARWLNAPVLLTVNTHGIARSLAALVRGFCGFDKKLNIIGIVANHSGSKRHAEWLAESLAFSSLPPILAFIPRGAFPVLPSRHLGLVSADHRNLSRTILDQLASVFEKHSDLERIIMEARNAPQLFYRESRALKPIAAGKVRLGLPYDEAFHFYYRDNLDALVDGGCELVYFSPLRDRHLPEDIHGLYFGGGYPEEHAGQLAENKDMIESIRRFALSGKPIYAECGGLIYLSQGIETENGQYFLTGVLPVWTRMFKRLKALGYREARLLAETLFGVRGTQLRGHEFHYSELAEGPGGAVWEKAYELKTRTSETLRVEGYRSGKILASYIHVHWASRPRVTASFIRHLEEGHGFSDSAA